MWVLQGILFNPVHTGPQSSFDPLKLWFFSRLLILPQRQRNSPHLWLFDKDILSAETRLVSEMLLAPFSDPILLGLSEFLYGYIQSFIFKGIPALFLWRLTALQEIPSRGLHFSTALSRDCWSPLPSLRKWPLSGCSHVWESCLKLSSPFL